MTSTCDVWFYHLERSGLEQALPELLEKTLARRWRALVRVRDPERLRGLDERLWTWRAESFLPHGRADGPEPERQPVLLTTGDANLNTAQVLFIVDGAELGPLDGFERCVVMFDGRDDEAVAEARRRWSQVKAGGANCSYWRQDEDGRWSKAA